jgi:hypothetical protein
MKKIAVLLILATVLFSSCGTICGGKITDCQKKGPGQGGAHRQIRPAALIGDILLFPIISLTVDFVDGAMYVPCSSGNSNGTPHHYN